MVLVSMDVEVLTDVVARLRRFREDVERERDTVVRAAAAAALCDTDLGRMDEFLPGLEDLARDLERRLDVATMMTTTGWAQTSPRGVVTFTVAGQDDSVGAQLAAFATSATARTPAGMASLDQRLARYGEDPAVMAAFYDTLGADQLVGLMSDAAGTAFATPGEIGVRTCLLGHLRAGLQSAVGRWGDLHAAVFAAALVDAATAKPAFGDARRPGGGAGALSFLLTDSAFSTVFLSTVAEKIDTYVRVTGGLDPWHQGGAGAQQLASGGGGLLTEDPAVALMSALRRDPVAFRVFFASDGGSGVAAARQGFWWSGGDATRLLVAEVSAAGGLRGVSLADVGPPAIARWWAGLPPGAQVRAEAEHWDTLGNLDGIPYDVRVKSNTIAITAAVDRATADKTGLEARLAALQAQLPTTQDLIAGSRAYGSVGDWDAVAQTKTQLATIEATLDRYNKYLHESTDGFDANGTRTKITGHQVVVFDPDHGRFAEIVGSLSARTKNIGVLVGGTGTNLTGMPGEYGRADEFVRAAWPSGSLTMITYLGGPMPQSIPEAVNTQYALDAAAGLRDFAAGIDRPDGVKVTVLGHSYGGSVVGAAEHVGMKVERVLQVESAGAGPGVSGVQDYAYPDTPRYSMTAPGDLIGLIQGVSAGPVGHGADPDELAGVVRLETGLIDNSNRSSALVEGVSSHSAVFTRYSTAWTNMLDVLTGQPVMLYTAPQLILRADETVETRYPMQDPSYDPPTVPVP
jgi:Alpha/beta hydrolase